MEQLQAPKKGSYFSFPEIEDIKALLRPRKETGKELIYKFAPGNNGK